MAVEIYGYKNMVAHMITHRFETYCDLYVYDNQIARPTADVYGQTSNYTSYQMAVYDRTELAWGYNNVSTEDCYVAMLPYTKPEKTTVKDGTLGWFAVIDQSNPANCFMTGTISAVGGVGDMWVESTSLTTGDTIKIRSLKFGIN